MALNTFVHAIRIKWQLYGQSTYYTIDKLNFKSHIINIRTVSNKKLSALCRISDDADLNKCKLLVNAFVEFQFSECVLLPISLITYILSVSLKFEACYITSQRGRVQSKECSFMFKYTFLAFFYFS